MLALVATLLLGQTHTRWEAAAQTQVRARTSTPQDEGTVVAGDFEVSPRLSGSVFNGPWTLTGSYGPTFRSTEPWVLTRNGRSFGDHSHVAAIEAAWAKEAIARLFVAEYFRYGAFDLSTVNRPGTGTVTMLPNVPALRQNTGTITELTTDSSAGFDFFLGKRLTLTTTGGFIYSGGADARSRESLPLYSAPRVNARLAWLATLRDTASAALGVQYIRFYQVPATATTPAREGARIFITELSASYQRQLAEQTGFDLTVGLTGMFGQLPNALNVLQSTAGVGPLVAASINHRATWRGQQVDLRADARVSPFVDRQGGTVYNRVEGGLGAAWSNTDHFSASLGTGAARSLPVATEEPLTSVYGEAGFGYQGDPWWRVDLVGRLAALYARRLLPIPMPAPLPSDMLPASPVPSPWEAQWVVGLSLTLMIGSDQPRTF